MCITVIILSAAAAAEGAPVVDDFDDDGTRDDGRAVRHNNKLFLPRAPFVCVFKLRTCGSFCPFLSSLQKVSRIIPKMQFRVLFCNPKYKYKYQRENLVVVLYFNPSQLFDL